MADRKITGHTAITAADVDPANDVIEIVDISDTTDAASGTNKKMTVAESESLFNPLQFLRGSSLDRYIPFNVKRNQQSPGTAAVTAGRFYSFPWYCDSVITIDRLAAEVTTGTTGNFQIGIFPSDSNGSPVGLAPVVSTGNIAVASTGVKTSTVSYLIYPGLYWIGFWSDTGNTFRSYGLTTAYQFSQGFPSSSFASGSNAHFSTESGIPSTHPALSFSSFVLPVICFRIV